MAMTLKEWLKEKYPHIADEWHQIRQEHRKMYQREYMAAVYKKARDKNKTDPT